MPFASLGLSDSFFSELTAHGYTTPTPIQSAVIPAVIQGKDVLGIAKTGSGKTASFVLPILHRLLLAPPTSHREPSVLVLVPTRELADQVRGVFEDFLKVLPARLHSLAVYGGVSINPQMQAVGNVDVLVATPGRLIELIEKKAIKLTSVTTLVLDEADKMLNLGFKEEMDILLQKLPQSRQNLLFSATLSGDVSTIRDQWLKNPEVIEIKEEKSLDTFDLIQQIGYFVPHEKKGPLLRYLIKEGNLKQVLVFASSVHKVDGIVRKLLKNGIDASAAHAKLGQQARRQVLHEFKAGEIRVLVATDLLARGIDIEFLPCVINYELPRSPKDYIHRIGRTGRAESPGDAISLIAPEERHHFKVIQKKMGKRVPIRYSEDINLHGY
jgi:ATP-dependent RNA helicase RhlE